MSAEPSESSKVLYPRPSAPKVDWFLLWLGSLLILSWVCFAFWENFTAAFYLVLVSVIVAILRGQRK